jgi:hypothetical protein
VTDEPGQRLRIIDRRAAEGPDRLSHTRVAPDLKAGRAVETAQAMEEHENPRTARPYDRGDRIALDAVMPIFKLEVWHGRAKAPGRRSPALSAPRLHDRLARHLHT